MGWLASMAKSVIPVIGGLHIAAIDIGNVLQVLEPLWLPHPSLARDLRARIENVLDWAKVRGMHGR